MNILPVDRAKVAQVKIPDDLVEPLKYLGAGKLATGVNQVLVALKKEIFQSVKAHKESKKKQ
jgi:hypothetical protein